MSGGSALVEQLSPRAGDVDSGSTSSEVDRSDRSFSCNERTGEHSAALSICFEVCSAVSPLRSGVEGEAVTGVEGETIGGGEGEGDGSSASFRDGDEGEGDRTSGWLGDGDEEGGGISGWFSDGDEGGGDRTSGWLRDGDDGEGDRASDVGEG